MSIEVLDLIIKVMLLIFFASASEILFASRLYRSSFFMFTCWLSIFRRTFLTAISAYVGLFNGRSTVPTEEIKMALMSGWAVFITDILLLIGLLVFFREIAEYWRMFRCKQLKIKNFLYGKRN